ncbi:hypothetical protein [Gordonibacter sp. An230]|uniref:hypothetical protein n=1 Tax=Gordonibacter sp. An230 TaxID=1965592 RepID=UPI0011211E93|nr:hypothetical protein [Gordonibacter sp. An230]
MKGNMKRWFAIAGACCALGIMLMMAALMVVGFDVRQLQMPVPAGISIPGVPASSEPSAAPSSPAAPAMPEVPAAPESPAASAAFRQTLPPAAFEVSGLPTGPVVFASAISSSAASVPSATASVASESSVVDSPKPSAGEEPPAAFGFSDKLSIWLRALSFVADSLW